MWSKLVNNFLRGIQPEIASIVQRPRWFFLDRKILCLSLKKASVAMIASVVAIRTAAGNSGIEGEGEIDGEGETAADEGEAEVEVAEAGGEVG